jgi:excinuclease ABC subunit B
LIISKIGKHLEAKRLEERTNFDLEMIGILFWNRKYSRYLDGRLPELDRFAY